MMLLELYIFMLAAFTGFMVISRVPPLLHTPLMAATNAISGISLVGSLIMAGAQHSRLATLLGFIAVVCATTNIVGGFLIVDRMLRMFQRTKREAGSGMAEAEERRKRAGRRVTDPVA
jgi:NAD(P) transhydrogenase subunit alpha